MDSSAPQLPRRRFLNWLLGTSLFGLFASVAYPVVRFLAPPDVPEASTNRVEAGPTNDPEILEKGYKIVRFGAEPVLVLKTAQGEFRAFGATCTHLDCIVEYQKDKRRIWCNCHNGEYDLNGQVVAGPPPRPLPRYEVHVLETGAGQPGTLVVSRS